MRQEGKCLPHGKKNERTRDYCSPWRFYQGPNHWIKADISPKGKQVKESHCTGRGRSDGWEYIKSNMEPAKMNKNKSKYGQALHTPLCSHHSYRMALVTLLGLGNRLILLSCATNMRSNSMSIYKSLFYLLENFKWNQRSETLCQFSCIVPQMSGKRMSRKKPRK
jgi:hypothetical protein